MRRQGVESAAGTGVIVNMRAPVKKEAEVFVIQHQQGEYKTDCEANGSSALLVH